MTVQADSGTMSRNDLWRVLGGLALTSFATLLLELNLIRLFDVILTPNYAYMIVTAAIFAFGLAGIYLSLFSIREPEFKLRWFAAVNVLFVLGIILVSNNVPYSFEKIHEQPVVQLFYISVLFFSLLLPFFVSGLIISSLFSRLHGSARRLYFFDLGGAAVGAVMLTPLLPWYGAGGVLFVVSGLFMLAAALFPSRATGWAVAPMLVVAVALLAYPGLRDGYIEVEGHVEKRGVLEARQRGLVEFKRWDPVQTIEVVDLPDSHKDHKHIAYDGGTQSSHFYAFDGDFAALRERVEHGDGGENEFWGKKVLLAHYLKRDSGARVLVLGSAGGQETKAALTYGASSVDGVELVGTVVELGKHQYAAYTGNLMNHPNVNNVHGEGRSFLRASGKTYDIIQIHSNHTPAGIANGHGALSPVYLQTVEAYVEYFQHLPPDGMLQINHHFYPRMLVTAAAAWRRLGRSDLAAHVLVIERDEGTYRGSLPTVIFKMTPWTRDEVREAERFMAPDASVVFHPIDRGNNVLPDVLLDDPGNALAGQAEYRLSAVTDDMPYFSFVRRHFREVDKDRAPFMDWGTESIMNSQLSGPLPMDVIHLIVVGVIALVAATVFVFAPLLFSDTGRQPWRGKAPVLIYFSCLGAGFILLELTLIQIFVKFIGYPVYAYGTVVFGLLASAGTGSLFAERLGLMRRDRWPVVFLAIIAGYAIFLLVYPLVFQQFISSPTAVRIGISVLLLAPLGFFMGIPFPVGITRLGESKPGAIPWAWGMNGLFTMIGGLASVVVAVLLGFRLTLAIGILIYVVAMWSMRHINAQATA